MPFRFSHVCDLLQHLEDDQSARSGVRTNSEIVREWFRTHHGLIAREDHDATPLLSTLLPEKRSDRVYFIREKRLQTIIGRGLGLGRCRIQQLARWNEPGSGVDLAGAVERILKETPNPACPVQNEVTVEEIDRLLHEIAAACRFSSPAVRRSTSGLRLTERETELGNMYKRLSARDAKWLTRLILKNFEPVILDQQLVYRSYHPFLPAIIQVQDDLAVAGRVLANVRRNRTVTGKAELAEFLKPALGVKIGRQPWFKGRSIKHCLDMSRGRMSCEEKMDGEYCQIHVDLSKGRNCIQIFSKSGKDSTLDRIALHESIRQSLQLGQLSCPIKKGCILEGELLVYSDKDGKILDFHKIRKHVSRSGSFLGTDQDSQRHPWEHLMIVYYDLFMVDDDSLLTVRQSERVKRLKELITEVPGRSAIIKREIIDCSRRTVVSDLRRAFAKCIVARGEGLVLKPDDPYFDFDTHRRPYSCSAIKLKKEYIGNFGDIGDFAAVGARYEAAKARMLGIPNLKWTHFYVGCLENKEDVTRFNRQPRFVVINIVELNTTQHQMFITHVSPRFVPFEENDAIGLRIEPGVDYGKRPSVIFVEPPVFDIRCFSFDKEGNTGFWSPRFPMVNKIHCDRTYLDALSFTELQEIAAREKEWPPPDDSQELLGWIAALEKADPQSRAAGGDGASQSTVYSTDAPTASSQVSTVGTERGHTDDSQPNLGSASLLSSPSIVRGSPTPLRPAPAAQSENATPVVEARLAGMPTPPASSAKPLDKAGVVVATAHQRVSATPTPHISSTAIPLVTAAGTASMATQRRSTDENKRAAEDSSLASEQRSKARRCSKHQTACSACRPVSESHLREPLKDVSESSSRRNYDQYFRPRLVGVHSMYQPSTEKEDTSGPKKVPSSLPTSFSFQGKPLRAPVQIAATQSAPLKSGSNTHTRPCAASAVASPGSCRFLPGFCTISNISFLLSPCIAGFLWVTEDLLATHSAEIFSDAEAWRAGTSSTQVASLTAATSAKKPRRKKKMILVDTRRVEATKTFLNQIKDLGLKRRNGKRDWVLVFDWRVLEELKEEETRCGRRGEMPGSRLVINNTKGVWRKHWVGLA